MTSRGEVPRATRAACREALEGVGFRKRAGDVYTLSVDGGEDVVGRVALSSARNGPGGRFEINPMVGVHHHGIEEALAEIGRQKSSEYDPATLLSSVGYLTPGNRYRGWYFETGCDFDAVASDLAQTVTQYAVPFMRAHATLSVITEELERLRYAGRESRKIRLPLAYWLSGRLDEAEAVLAASLDEIAGEDNLAAREFRQFAADVRVRLSQG